MLIKDLKQAMELMEQAIGFLQQNRDPRSRALAARLLEVQQEVARLREDATGGKP